MASVPKTARVVARRDLARDTVLIDLELAAGGPIGFRGGQYVIVNTGAVGADGKAVKRAYSLLSRDDAQDRAQIAVLRLEPGPGSRAMHLAAVGDTLSFSGPWGKMLPEPDAGGRALVLATDTGITAALGLVTSRAFAPLAADAELVWYVVPARELLPLAFVRERLEGTPVRLRVEAALPAHHPERLDHARAIALRDIDANGLPSCFYAAGDGAIVHPLAGELVARGVAPERARLEAFFNNPARKAP